VPAGTYVSRIEPSWRDTATFYVTFDNHRRGDFAPYVYATRDGGRTFRSIAATLPTGGPDFVHVIREDPANPDVLYLGTDVGVYLSTDRGASWRRFMHGLPTVPVHDLRVHPRERELIAGTHGRSIWIVDVGPLAELNATVAAKPVHVFAPKTAHLWGDRPIGGQNGGGFGSGHQVWEAPSPGYGAEIVYRIAPGAAVSGPVRVAILGPMGDTLRAFAEAPGTPGVHRILWDLRGTPRRARPLTPAERRDSLERAREIAQTVDSLVAEEVLPRAMADRVRAAALEGTPALQRLAAPGATTAPDPRGVAPVVSYPRFVERPGESGGGAAAPAVPATAPPAAPPAGRAAGALLDEDTMDRVMGALRGVLGRGGSGAGGPEVPTGTYVVAVTANGATTRVPLRVERAAAAARGAPAASRPAATGAP
jgi:hypothetical protein